MFHKKLALLKLKELLITLFSFLMVTMSLYHVFFESKSPEIERNNEDYRQLVIHRNSTQDKLLEQLKKKDINVDEYLFKITALEKKSKEKIKILNREKIRIIRDFSFRGRSSFHFWLFVFGLVTLGLFFSCKSLYQDIKNGSSFKVYFISICGIVISLFWVIHLTFMTQKDFSKHSYVGMILLCSIFFSVFGYYAIKHIASKKLRKELQLKEAFTTIEQLQKEVLKKQEEQRAKERQRISEELHDGVLGKLFGTRMALGFLDINTATNKEKYQRFLNELQQIEKEIRDVSHKLSSNLDGSDIGFVSIVKQLLHDKGTIGNFTHNLTIDTSINWKALDEVYRLNLYRMIQETIQNIIKHAKATEVIINIKLVDDTVVTNIIDNGIGFNTKRNKKGIGLKNITTRAKRIDGYITIESSINKGTYICITTPYSSVLT